MATDIEAPSTETVRARYHMAGISDDTSVRIAAMSRRKADAEFDLWLDGLKDQLREELRAEQTQPSTDVLLSRAAKISESWQMAERPFDDAHFDSDDALAELHAAGSIAVSMTKELAKALRGGQESPAEGTGDAGEGRTIVSGSVADIYATSPHAPILIEALDHRPGENTSEDFKRGYYAAVEVSRIRGAAALQNLAEDDEWEYGWRSFFANGDEHDWWNCSSREDAEFQLRENRELEDANYSGDDAGKLTYSLWRRRKTQTGAWERVEENTDGQD